MTAQAVPLAPRPPSVDLQHFARLAEVVGLAGRHVLEIGCGVGGLLFLLRKAGAKAIGLEVQPARIDAALQAGLPADSLILGDGRTLPFEDSRYDLVLMVNSFHHVPDTDQAALLSEIRRVLRPQGACIVIEPLPDGDLSHVIKPIDDETEVRTSSQNRLREGVPGLGTPDEFVFPTLRFHAGVGDLFDRMAVVDPARAKAVRDPQIRDEVKRRFEAAATPVQGGVVLEQPSVIFRFSMLDEMRRDK